MVQRRVVVSGRASDVKIVVDCVQTFADVEVVPDVPGAHESADVVLAVRSGVVDRVVPDGWGDLPPRSTLAVLVHGGRLDPATAADWVRRTLRAAVPAAPAAPGHLVPSEPSSLPRLVRDAIREVWPDDERIDSVLLVASEVVSNAVQHTDSSPSARVSADGGRLLVEAGDDRPAELPCLADPVAGPPAEGLGHGLRIVAALADRWGVTAGPARKVVWCEFDRAR